MCRILTSILKHTLNVEYAFFNTYDPNTKFPEHFIHPYLSQHHIFLTHKHVGMPKNHYNICNQKHTDKKPIKYILGQYARVGGLSSSLL